MAQAFHPAIPIMQAGKPAPQNVPCQDKWPHCLSLSPLVSGWSDSMEMLPLVDSSTSARGMSKRPCWVGVAVEEAGEAFGGVVGARRSACSLRVTRYAGVLLRRRRASPLPLRLPRHDDRAVDDDEEQVGRADAESRRGPFRGRHLNAISSLPRRCGGHAAPDEGRAGVAQHYRGSATGAGQVEGGRPGRRRGQRVPPAAGAHDAPTCN